MIFPRRCSPQECCRQNDSQQQILRTEEVAKVHKETRQKDLNTIAQGNARCDIEKDGRLPPTEFATFLHTHARDIKRDEQQEHGDGEMIGYNE